MYKLKTKPISIDNEEKNWHEFRFNLENYNTLANALLLVAETQPTANSPAGEDVTSKAMGTQSCTLYALVATLTTGNA